MSPFKKINFFFWYSFFRSYRAFLPSSFSTIISSALIYFICSPVSVLVRFFAQHAFLENEIITTNTFICLYKTIYILTFLQQKILSKRAFAHLSLKTDLLRAVYPFPENLELSAIMFYEHYLSLLMLALSPLVNYIFLQKCSSLLFSRAFRYHLKRLYIALNSSLRYENFSPYIFSE